MPDLNDLALQALNRLRKKLLDLTRKNRLLNFKETRSTLRIVDELPDQVYETLVTNGINMAFLPLPEEESNESDSDNVDSENLELFDSKQPEASPNGETHSANNINTSNELPLPEGPPPERHQDLFLQTPYYPEKLDRRCKNILKNARTAIDETGSNFLFLAIGFLDWYEDDNSSVINKAPLILVPVEIEKLKRDSRTQLHKFKLSFTYEEMETNWSLAEKLSHEFDMKLPEFEAEMTPEQYFNEVSNLILNKSRWKVAREMVVGLFSFSKILIYIDLDSNRWPQGREIHKEENAKKILIGNEPSAGGSGLILGENCNLDDNKVVEQAPLVMDADSSQHTAILEVLSGKDLVIEGPPGTGKSQTIANLIATFLKDGKTVLFVAEKRAALEVVRDRLDKVGLGEFCLELHSHKTKRDGFMEDLEKRFQRNFNQVEGMDQLIEEMGHTRDKLREYVDLVNRRVGNSEITIFNILWGAERWRAELNERRLTVKISNPLNLNNSDIRERVRILKEAREMKSEIPAQVAKTWKWFRVKNILPDMREEIINSIRKLKETAESGMNELGEQIDTHEVPLELQILVLDKIKRINSDALKNFSAEFDENFAKLLVEPEALTVLYELRQSVESYNALTDQSNHLNNNSNEISYESIKRIYESAAKLSSANLGELRISELHNVLNQCNSALGGIKQLNDQTKNINKIVTEIPNTPNEFEVIHRRLSIFENSPSEIMFNTYYEHVSSESSAIFQKAKSECDRQKLQLEKSAEDFIIEKAPSPGRIKKLILTLEDYKDKRFRIFYSEYRDTRRSVKGFLKNHKLIHSPTIFIDLDRLSTLFSHIQKTQMNENYRRVLGPLYLGVDTDWKLLETCIRWALDLGKELGSPAIASKIIKNIVNAREQIIHLSEIIETSLIKIRICQGLLQVPEPETQTLSSFYEQLDSLIPQIKESISAFNAVSIQANLKVNDVKESASAWLSAWNLRKEIEENQNFIRLFPAFFKGVQTNIGKLLETGQWVQGIHDDENIPDPLARWLIENNCKQRVEIISKISLRTKSMFEQWGNEFSKLNGFEKCSLSGFLDGGLFSLQNFCEKLDQCIQTERSLIGLSDYWKVLEDAHELGLTNIIDAMESGKIEAADTHSIFMYGLFSSMSREIFQKYPELASFTRVRHEATKNRFIELDKEIILKNRQELANKISKSEVPGGISHGRVSDFTEMGLLNHLLNNRRQRKRNRGSIREWVRRSSNALRALKPCFMMSPLSVTQYLQPGNAAFDLLVMDEASQIKPEDVLSSFVRAKQIVVVGDPNQLPPTSFFDLMLDDSDDEEEETAVASAESILNIASNYFDRRRLIWHYRSQHESLIAFSNREFYDDSLLIFPSPAIKHPQLGVKKIRVDGKYKKGRNPVEARRVAMEVANYFLSGKSSSLGVVTFNKEQRDLIDEFLDQFSKENPILEEKLKISEESKEPFFIKNLENVQGDERDIIFISTTFGLIPKLVLRTSVSDQLVENLVGGG